MKAIGKLRIRSIADRSPPKDPFSKILLCFSILVLVLLAVRLEVVISTRLPINKWGDYVYFHTAAETFLAGQSAYGEDYLSRLAAYEGVAKFPLFYPPQVLPLLAPLGLFSFETATEIFFRLNGAFLIIGLFLSAMIFRNREQIFDDRLGAIAMLGIVLVTGALMPAAYSSVLNSNFSNFLLVGMALWMIGTERQSNLAVGVGLTILMLKPSVAVALVVLSLLSPKTRPGVLLAFALSGGLYLIGTWGINPFYALSE